MSLDVDCVLHGDPRPPITGIGTDIAIHYFRDIEPLPGTLMVGATINAKRLLQNWHEINLHRPERSDRSNIAEAVKQFEGLKIKKLPPELCFIFDRSREVYTGVEPIIEHLQASRGLKNLPIPGVTK